MSGTICHLCPGSLNRTANSGRVFAQRGRLARPGRDKLLKLGFLTADDDLFVSDLYARDYGLQGLLSLRLRQPLSTSHRRTGFENRGQLDRGGGQGMQTTEWSFAVVAEAAQASEPAPTLRKAIYQSQSACHLPFPMVTDSSISDWVPIDVHTR